MDDTQKIQQQPMGVDQTQQVSSQSTDDTQQSVPTEQQQPTEKKEEIPAEPVSPPSKEGGPSMAMPEKLLSPSVPEMEISPELHNETGAEAVKEVPELTPEDTQAGIVHAKESTPVSVAPATTIVLPMSQQQAQQTVKLHKKVKESLFWFAMLIMRQWQIAEKNKNRPRPAQQEYGETKKEAS